MCRQRHLRSLHPAHMLQTKNSSSSHRRMVKIRLMKKKPTKEREISQKYKRKGSTWGTILNVAEYQTIHKDWRKHDVVLYKRNQGKCTDTSRTRCQCRLEEFKTQNIWPANAEVLLTADKRFKHYKMNEDSISLKDGLLFRKYYGKTGKIKIY